MFDKTVQQELQLNIIDYLITFLKRQMRALVKRTSFCKKKKTKESFTLLRIFDIQKHFHILRK